MVQLGKIKYWGEADLKAISAWSGLSLPYREQMRVAFFHKTLCMNNPDLAL